MMHIFPFQVKMVARVALLLGVLLAGLGARPQAARASHIKAGDIQAKIDTTSPGNPRRVFFKMVLYTTSSGPNVVDEDKVTIFFGDGTSSCIQGIDRVPGSKRPVPGNPDISSNIYLFEHTFPSAGSFMITYFGENRVFGVRNTDNSGNQSFYISTRITLDPALGRNRSPILTAPAVDRGAIGQVFLHNPAAYDADGDSLAFHLRPSQRVPGFAKDVVGGAPCTGSGAGTGNNTPVPQVLTNFRYPNDPAITGAANPPVQVAYEGRPGGIPGAPAIFVQDVNTGQITWNAPVSAGDYNVAMVVEEWRRTPLGVRLIGEVIRDMQITITAASNLRPTITIPEDICVVAGETVTGLVTAVDGVSATSPQTAVTLFAYSGIIPPATFRQSALGPPQARGTFTWQTQCSNVARLPYLVVFKAQDNPANPTPANPPLIDEKTWRITVIGPAPQNLRATPDASTGLNRVTLNWNTYQCANASLIHIYRKEGSGPDPGPCETGIPASSGYVRIASVPATATEFIDNNRAASGANLGLDRGKTYCYRIYAEFPLPAGGASLASREACATLQGRAVRLTNVDVEETSPATGRILVRWTQPRPTTGPVFEGTPSYVLRRGEGRAPATFTAVRTFTALSDTFFVDSGLNTRDLQYTYQVDFVRTLGNGQTPTETSSPASSVRVTATPLNPPTGITVSWTYQVPWENTTRPVVIYRRLSAPGSVFAQVATAPTGATGGTYVDRDPGLVRNQTYCYYVQTNGLYAGIPYLNSLLNKSQEQCASLIPPPCPPVLTLEPTDCEELANRPEFPRPDDRYTNRLRWTLSSVPAGCDANVAGYRVYYRPTPTGAFTLLGTTPETTFTHGNLAFSGGCYAVQAVAASGALSDTSNVACQDNCVFFKLPNIFTPNADNQNDTFRPKNSSPVRRVRFQAFNRWGVKVFENVTTSADRVLINWNGSGYATEAGAGTRAVDGIYYYLAEVEFADFGSTRRTYKGWVEIVR